MRVTVKDIANDLGISQGTVSKALIGKRGISEQTRLKVLEAAERLGYKVNRVAQTLSRSTIYIGVISSKEWIEYYGEISNGIERAAAILADYNVETVFQWVSNPMAELEVEAAIRKLKEQNVNAVLFCLATVGKIADSLKILTDAGIAAVIVGTNVDGVERYPVVRLDSDAAGHLAAEFMCHIVPDNRPTAIFIGNKDILDHSGKVEGYLQEMNTMGRRVVGVFETQDDPDLAYLLAKKTIRDYPDLGGIYVATGNSITVCDCIEELDLCGNVKVIGTDIFPDIVSKMNKGVMQGIIYQNPKLQGEMAVNSVYMWLSEHKKMPNETLLVPQLVLRSNVTIIQK